MKPVKIIRRAHSAPGPGPQHLPGDTSTPAAAQTQVSQARPPGEPPAGPRSHSQVSPGGSASKPRRARRIPERAPVWSPRAPPRTAFLSEAPGRWAGMGKQAGVRVGGRTEPQGSAVAHGAHLRAEAVWPLGVPVWGVRTNLALRPRGPLHHPDLQHEPPGPPAQSGKLGSTPSSTVSGMENHDVSGSQPRGQDSSNSTVRAVGDGAGPL